MSHLLFTIWQCRCFTDMSHNQPPSSRRLCEMATCDISENTHEIICYQYVEHASSLRIRQKLLVQSEGHLTLVMVNKMACQLDGAHRDSHSRAPSFRLNHKVKPKCQFNSKAKNNPANSTAASYRTDVLDVVRQLACSPGCPVLSC